MILSDHGWNYKNKGNMFKTCDLKQVIHLYLIINYLISGDLNENFKFILFFWYRKMTIYLRHI